MLGPNGIHCQAVTDLPQFEVASIKLSQPISNGGWIRSDPGRIDYKAIDLKALILMAYSVPNYRVIWPEWLNKLDPSYDVVATMPPGTTRAQLHLMLQGMLATRLNLKMHREARELAMYALVIAKNGPRIHKTKLDPDINEAESDPDEPHNTYTIGQGPAGWHLVGPMSILQLASTFRYELDHPMVDMTGLEGYYDVDLVWSHETAPAAGRGAPPASADNIPTASVPAGGNSLSLFVALERQLGLKVEPRRSQTEMLVIDRVEKVPTDN